MKIKDCEKLSFYALEDLTAANVSKWEENTLLIIDLCDELLKRSSPRFWNAIAKNGCIIADVIISYLEACPRYLEPELRELVFSSKNEHTSSVQKTLHKKIFQLLYRLSDSEDAKVHINFENFFDEFLHPKALFDLPMMLDICALYEKHHHKGVTRMVDAAFASHPPFDDDVAVAVPHTIELFQRCTQKVALLIQTADERSTTECVASEEADNLKTLKRITSFLMDSVWTLTAFANVRPAALKIYHTCGLSLALVSLYEDECIKAVLFLKFELSQPDSTDTKKQNRLEIARVQYLQEAVVDLFRKIVAHVFLDPLSCGESPDCELLENFSSLMAVLAVQKRFGENYEAKYPLAADVKTLEACKNADRYFETLTALKELSLKESELTKTATKPDDDVSPIAGCSRQDGVSPPDDKASYRALNRNEGSRLEPMSENLKQMILAFAKRNQEEPEIDPNYYKLMYNDEYDDRWDYDSYSLRVPTYFEHNLDDMLPEGEMFDMSESEELSIIAAQDEKKDPVPQMKLIAESSSGKIKDAMYKNGLKNKDETESFSEGKEDENEKSFSSKGRDKNEEQCSLDLRKAGNEQKPPPREYEEGGSSVSQEKDVKEGKPSSSKTRDRRQEQRSSDWKARNEENPPRKDEAGPSPNQEKGDKERKPSSSRVGDRKQEQRSSNWNKTSNEEKLPPRDDEADDEGDDEGQSSSEEEGNKEEKPFSSQGRRGRGGRRGKPFRGQGTAGKEKEANPAQVRDRQYKDRHKNRIANHNRKKLAARKQQAGFGYS